MLEAASHCVVSGFRRDLNEVGAVQEFYAAWNGSLLSDVSGQPIGPVLKG